VVAATVGLGGRRPVYGELLRVPATLTVRFLGENSTARPERVISGAINLFVKQSSVRGSAYVSEVACSDGTLLRVMRIVLVICHGSQHE
jgi:hypothetical protein